MTWFGVGPLIAAAADRSTVELLLTGVLGCALAAATFAGAMGFVIGLSAAAIDRIASVCRVVRRWHLPRDCPRWLLERAWPRRGVVAPRVNRVDVLSPLIPLASGVSWLLAAHPGATPQIPPWAQISIALSIAFAAYLVLNYFTAGKLRLLYLGTPYAPYGTLSVRIGQIGGGMPTDSLRVVLRCLSRSSGRSGLEWCRTAWKVDDDLTPNSVGVVYSKAVDVTAPPPESDVDVTFELRPGLPGTDLSAWDRTCWELEVVGVAKFLLPVYDDAAAGRG